MSLALSGEIFFARKGGKGDGGRLRPIRRRGSIQDVPMPSREGGMGTSAFFPAYTQSSSSAMGVKPRRMVFSVTQRGSMNWSR